MSIEPRKSDEPGEPALLTPARTGAPERSASAPSATGCCGGAAPAGADACCALDAEAKSSGGSGCGCGSVFGAPKPRECC